MKEQELQMLEAQIERLNIIIVMSTLKIHMRTIEALLQKHNIELFEEYAEKLIVDVESDKSINDAKEKLKQLQVLISQVADANRRQSN